MDFLIVATVGFGLLFVLVILRHQRQRLISLTARPIQRQSWIAQRLPMPSPGTTPRPISSAIATLLWSRRHPASCGHGYTPSSDSPAITLAERPCGAADRLNPPGIPR